jgi:intein/homing endonuclease
MIIPELTEEECYLLALFEDESGIDFAEFCLIDEERDDGLFRAWPFQYAWWRSSDQKQISAGARSVGKALDVTTPILTVDGWKTMETIQIGDMVFDELGNQTRVTNVFATLYNRDCYELVFDDGSSVVADGDHLWVTETLLNARKSARFNLDHVYRPVTSLEISKTVKHNKENNHRIPIAKSIDLPNRELSINPWTLGLWLGDGNSCDNGLTVGNQDIFEISKLINQDGYNLRKVVSKKNGYTIDEMDQFEWKIFPTETELNDKKKKGKLSTKEIFSIRTEAYNGWSIGDLILKYNKSRGVISKVLLGQTNLKVGGPIRGKLHSKFKIKLDELGLLNNKHIPQEYLMSSNEQRLELLQGIMDSDGHCTKVGRCEITLKSKKLINNVFDLLISMGQKPTIHEKEAICNGTPAGIVYRLNFTPNGIVPFKLKRKASRVVVEYSASSIQRISSRRIVSCVKVASRPVRCISVDSPNNLFLAGKSLIPTHNSKSISLRAAAFPLVHSAGQEMVITAPTQNHLDLITGTIENLYTHNALASQLITKITHKPFKIQFSNGSRIVERIPHDDGKNVKGSVKLNSLVLTRDRGMIEVQNVTKNDYVWSHLKRWCKVLDVYELEEQDAFKIEGQGGREVVVNADHRFYVRNDLSKQPGKTKRQLGDFTWEWVDDLTESKYNGINSFWTACDNFGVGLDIPEPDWFKTSRVLDLQDSDFWWLVGRYVADGNADDTRWQICAHKKDHDLILGKAESLGMSYNVTQRKHSTGDIINFSGKPMGVWLRKYFGHMAYGKEIPTWLLTIEENFREAFLEGYLSGDGATQVNQVQTTRIIGTASDKLALGLATLGHTLGYNVSFNRSKVKTTEIMGVPLKNEPYDSLRVRLNKKGRGVRDKQGYVSYKIGKVIPVEKQKFYGLVTEDASYWAEGILHHNTHPIHLEQDEACFPGETLILTSSGHKRIDEIIVGDEVLTHKNHWKKVLNVWDRGERETITVKGQGHQNLTVTPNHRFYAKQIIDFKDRKNKWGIKLVDDADWIKAEDLDYCLWSSPTKIPAIQNLPAIIPKAKTGDSDPIFPLTEDFLWCLGLYLAEGSTSSSYGKNGKLNKTTWSIHIDEVPYVVSRLKAAGLRPYVQPVNNTENCMNVVVSSVMLAPWMEENCGKGCYNKSIPMWVYSLNNKAKQWILDGLIYGDGCDGSKVPYSEGRSRLTTTSKKLAYETKLLAQSIGLYSTVYFYPGGGICVLQGKEYVNSDSYEVIISKNGQGYKEEDKVFTRTKKIDFHGDVHRVYDIEVEDDHSFVAEGIIVHNSDYPEAGWIEINETPKLQNPAGRWRAHGVTRGVGDTFDNIINGRDSTWTVHRIPATYRPNWTEAEREEKKEVYGGEDSVDFRRNVLGLPGDGNSPLFVLHRLLAATDTDESSSFNRDEYYYKLIDEAMVREVDDIEDILDIPAIHKKYTNFWIGMDVGWTESPSVITIFAETKLPKVEGVVLKLVTRLILRRMDAENQVKVMTKIMEIYHPLAFAMDATGAGAPLLTWLEKDVRENPANKFMLDRIKGFGFSEKVIVKFDPAVQINVNDPDGYLEAAIKRPFIEASTDAMRMYVDTRRMQLPYDKELIGELQATTIQNTKAHRDAYGRTVRKKGMHSLDAMRMATLAFDTHDIDEFIAKHKNIYQRPAPILVF